MKRKTSKNKNSYFNIFKNLISIKKKLCIVMLSDVDVPPKLIVLQEHPYLCEAYPDSADMSNTDSYDSMYELYCDADA
jgi:hypothetical protein